MSWLRKYKLTAGKSGTPGFETSELRVAFSISRSEDKSGNSAQLSIWDLNKEHREMVTDKDCYIELQAGYEDTKLITIFTGYVTYGDTEPDGADRKTSLELVDGRVPVRDTYSSKAYSGSTNGKKVIDDIAQDMTAKYTTRLTRNGVLVESKTNVVITGGVYTYAMTKRQWQTILNGGHTYALTVTSASGVAGSANIAFTKNISRAIIKSEPFAVEMGGEEAKGTFTDPPYNANYEGKSALLSNKTILNDHMDGGAFYEFLLRVFRIMWEVSAPGAAAYVFHADSEGLNFRRAFVDAGFALKQCLVWVKNVFTLGRQDYQWQHEPVLYGWKEGAAHYFVDDRSQSTVIDAAAPPDIRKMTKPQLVEFTAALLEQRQEEPSTVLRCDKPLRSDEHPTMKPVPLVGRLIKNSSRPNDLVFDPFGGSGTTLIAAERLGRRARLCELDPRFCDVILQRWEAATGGKAILIK